MNAGERIGIQTLALYSEQGKHIKQILRVIDTGSNKYRVFVENIPDIGIKYSVIKEGKEFKEIQIHRVTKDGVLYETEKAKLPNSVLHYIIDHCINYTNYIHGGMLL